MRQPISLLEEWVRLIKDPDETWTLFNIDKKSNAVVHYQYNVVLVNGSKLTKKVFLKFENNRLKLMEKHIGIDYISSPQEVEGGSKLTFISIFLSLVAIEFFLVSVNSSSCQVSVLPS
ncbi:MAG: hypothetical protein R2877_04370 [Bdellovibrionota bacterium]